MLVREIVPGHNSFILYIVEEGLCAKLAKRLAIDNNDEFQNF